MYDVVVIGGGPAGMASAIESKRHAKKVAIIERNEYLGGILMQYIHNGFGVHYLKRDLTGPEFANYLIDFVKKEEIDVFCDTHIISVEKNRNFIIKSSRGIIESRSIVFATGCMEKTRYMLNIPGDRPSGVFTAGTAQAFIDLYGYLPGKRVVIFGSGDIGLIVARRFAMEGADVIGVYEILPYPGALPRNITQCLDDYKIPLYLEHTILEIRGRRRVEGVVVGKIKNGKIIEKKFVECDTVIIAAGLIPNNKILKNMGAEIDPRTKGPVVNEFLENSIRGTFSCGNSLVVNDLVDYAVFQGEIAGKYASLYAMDALPQRKFFRIRPGNGIKFVVPQKVSGKEDVNLILRVEKPYNTAKIKLGKVERKYRYLNPATMVFFNLPMGEIEKDETIFVEEIK